MPAEATINATCAFRTAAQGCTANAVSLAAEPASLTVAAEGNTIGQIVIDPDDAITGDNQKIIISLMPAKVAFTGATNDKLTSAGHGLTANKRLRLTTTGTLPAGLSAAPTYFVLYVDANDFKVSLTPGGTPAEITDTGTGTHYWQKFADPVITYEYPTDGPDAPPVVNVPAGESVPDFTNIRAIEATLAPRDRPEAQEFTGAVDDKLTTTAHGQTANTRIRLATTGTLPAGLAEDTDYYLRDVTADDFKVSLTPGGAAESITDTGTGTHTWRKCAGGSAWITAGDPAVGQSYFSLCLTLDYDPDEGTDFPVWVGGMPEGVLYDPAYPLTVKFLEDVSNTNLRLTLTLLGN